MHLQIRVALYGGIDLSPENVAFIHYLAHALLADPHVVLISGGGYDPEGVKTSVDFAAYQAAKAYVERTGQDLAQRFHTWLPQTSRAGFERMGWGQVITLHGTPRARRFRLVESVDALITIAGRRETATVLELATALRRVALPIGFTGGDSARLWETDRTYFQRTLDIDDALAQSLNQPPRSSEESAEIAEAVAIAVLKKTRRRCLVLMDFEDAGHATFLKNVVIPAAASAGFAVHKLDEQESAGDILSLFLDRLADSHAIIVDLTGLNPNVLYELGRVHQHNAIQPLLITRAEVNTPLPFYVSRNLVHLVGRNRKRAFEVIKRHLEDERRRLVR